MGYSCACTVSQFKFTVTYVFATTAWPSLPKFERPVTSSSFASIRSSRTCCTSTEPQSGILFEGILVGDCLCSFVLVSITALRGALRIDRTRAGAGAGAATAAATAITSGRAVSSSSSSPSSSSLSHRRQHGPQLLASRARRSVWRCRLKQQQQPVRWQARIRASE